MKILVSFSGGKDSQACLIQAFKQYPYVEEVLEYVKEHTPDMFEPEGGYACMSLFHGLCE